MDNSTKRPSTAMARANAAARARDERIHRSPVTAAEIERLKREREAPRMELTLTPDGYSALTIDRKREAVREQRIFKGSKRLDRQSQRLRSEHERTR